jgi:hypothetical protein
MLLSQPPGRGKDAERAIAHYERCLVILTAAAESGEIVSLPVAWSRVPQ